MIGRSARCMWSIKPWQPGGIVLLGVVMWLASCSYDSSLTDVECDSDGQCGQGVICDEGYCVPETESECEGENEECSGECVDLSSHREHCGQCGLQCEADQVCEEGLCVSEGGEECEDDDETWCAGQCVDVMASEDHCGQCDTACPQLPEELEGDGYVECREGNCQFGCDAEDAQLCGVEEKTDGDVGFDNAQCVDVMNSVEHCGECDNACSAVALGDVWCDEGVCEVACVDEEGIEECDGDCVDVLDDEEHCGACGNDCGDQQICRQGQCLELPECDPEAEPFGGGSGGPDEPYAICAPKHLRNIDVEEEWEASFALVDDIDFGGEDPLAPIGRGDYSGTFPIGEWSDRFEGNFWGYGFAIKNLTIEGGGEDRTGLFGFLTTTASVTDVRLVSPLVDGENLVGALAGRNQGEVKGVTVVDGDVDGAAIVGAIIGRNQGVVESTVVEDTAVVGGDQVGGIAGRNEVGVEMSLVEDTTVTGAGRVGGAVGRNEGSVVDVTVLGSKSVGTSRVGGAVGSDLGGLQGVWTDGVEVEASGEAAGGLLGAGLSDIEGCHASAQVSGHDVVGGLVGRTAGDVVESSARGSVSADGERIGGLVGRLRAVQQTYGGYSQPSIYRSYADVDVDAAQSEQVGGLVGRSEGHIYDSYSLGTVSGGDVVGGLVGFMWREGVTMGPALSDVYRSYVWGETTGQDVVGGLVGERLDVGGDDMPQVHDSYWNVTVSVEDSDGGEPLEQNEFSTVDNFTTWEFGDVWEMGSERPVLGWE